MRENMTSGDKIESRLWYVLPIFIGIIGGVIAYFILKNSDANLAKNCLWLGIISPIIIIGIFIVPIGSESGPPYYLITGLILIGVGIVLAYLRLKRKI